MPTTRSERFSLAERALRAWSIWLALLALAFVWTIVSITTRRGYSDGAIVATFLVPLTIASFASLYGLRRLRNWSRFTALAPTVVSLLFFPAGTAMAIYVLCVLLARPWRPMFSSTYGSVEPARPVRAALFSTIIVLVLLTNWIVLALLVLRGTA